MISSGLVLQKKEQEWGGVSSQSIGGNPGMDDERSVTGPVWEKEDEEMLIRPSPKWLTPFEHNHFQKHNDTMGDAMLSFGEGYATRSEEEGFGGIYGGNTTLHDDDQILHTGVPAGVEYEEDDKQGSEVKEKERARNQTHAASHHHPS